MQTNFADFAPEWHSGLSAQELDTISEAREILRRLVSGRRSITTWDQLTDYLIVSMAPMRAECLRVLYLDRKNRLIADEETARGSVDHCPIYPREIAKRALALDASAVIVAHNHPSGDATPSTQDGQMSRELMATLKAIDVTMHDSVVVGGGNIESLRALGELD